MKKCKALSAGSVASPLFLALLSLFCLLPHAIEAQDSNYNPFWENITKPTHYDHEYNIQEGSVSITAPGSYHIFGTGIETANKIMVTLPSETTDVAYIVLENVNHVSDGYSGGMFLEKGIVALELRGDNYLISNRSSYYTSDSEGLHVSNGATLVITKESDGSNLTVQGGRNNAALGEHWGNRPGTIVINGGNLRINADVDGGSAIGTPYDPKGGAGHSIYLNGGYIEANGGSKGRSISCVEKLYITGGTIKAPQGIEGTQVYLSGGSVETSLIIPDPVDLDGNALTQRIIPVTPYTAVTELEGADNYNLNDMCANKDGNLFLWLPQATATPTVSKSFIPPTIRLDNRQQERFHRSYFITDSHQAVVTPKLIQDKEVYYLDPGKYTYKETNSPAQIEFEADNIATPYIDYYTVIFEDSPYYSVPEIFLTGQKIDQSTIYAFSRQYHYIKSWHTNKQDTGLTWDFDHHTVRSATTLYAQWAPNPIIQDRSFNTSVAAAEDKEIEIDLSNLIDATDNSGPKTFSLQPGAPSWITINGEKLHCTFKQVSGTHRASVLIKAENGNEKTVVFSFVGKPIPSPSPSYTWYKVILPAVDGIKYVRNSQEVDSLEAEVIEGSNFSFFLKGETGKTYAVSTSRGEVLEPWPWDGKYVIRDIVEDLTVRIASTPLAIDGVQTDGIQIYTLTGALGIRVDRPQPITISTTGGALVKHFTAPAGESQVSLAPGFYAVQAGRDKGVVVRIR